MVDVGHHLFLMNKEIRLITIDHNKKTINEVIKCSLFQSSISLVILSIIIIEKIQKIGLKKQVKQYRIAIFFHCLSGCRNLFRFFQSNNQFFDAIFKILK